MSSSSSWSSSSSFSSSSSSSSFSSSSNYFLDQLKNNGYAVIPNVLSNEECKLANDGLWNWLSDFSEGKIKSDDNTTWEKNWPYTMGKKGIIQQYKIGHSQFVWDIRQNPKVVKVFEQLWNDDNLLCSFDGINIQIPPEVTNKYADPYGIEWHHMDQSTLRPEFECVQGFVDINGTNFEDGCLVVRNKSHLYFSEYAKHFGVQEKSDWVKLSMDHNSWFDSKGCTSVRVTSPPGSLVLWDSRTVHANSTALKSRNKPDRFRFVVYVCMTPKKLITKAALKKKQLYFEEGRMTSHWPHKIKVFPKIPQLFGQINFYKHGFEWADKNFIRPNLTDLGMKLAGF